MSDLDADLYGDLYGNDEGENEQPQEENEPHQPAMDQAPETPAIKAESPEAAPKPIPTVTEKSFANGTPSQAPATNGASAASYTQPAPQQIPTYEQPLPNEYREAPPPRSDGGYSNIPVNERSVRPSEMKDEG
ncbi:hypothetical protein HYPSUDRAFT_202741 [Hypholoma sublateritium FD-334 SS-4]|uniref:Uncharacterized protein n=1 Tax=Hypholoma sublateritium (strain FD-334 SS-4) TaxID=945553 RepID=A0A0D2NS18_HYPSF|nr:hypothetical protein HYPSUDRAFT_202741 [Hypholoma sublateritium FD-334 SS-4]